MKTLFLCSNTPTEASMRFRVQQFLEPMRRAGHDPRLSVFFGSEARSWSSRVVRGTVRRALDVLRARAVDRIFVHREAFPLSFNEYSRALPSTVPLIFDFDDAVYLARRPGGWRSLVSRPQSTDALIARADIVFAGSPALAEYAQRLNPDVRVVPTVVDTSRFVPRKLKERGLLTIGWIGSPSTAPYLQLIREALERTRTVAQFRFLVVGAGAPFPLVGVPTEERSWTLSREVLDFQDIDIGVYPLATDTWAQAKCGFKAIQYMACGIPFVASPVGPVREIVRDGSDGLWAQKPSQWVEALVTLLRSPELRMKLAASGRRRAIDSYSLDSLFPSWISCIEAASTHGSRRSKS